MKRFRWNQTTSAEGPLAEVNMTPLIDVSLVLVVILLLATPLAFESSLGVSRAATANNAVSEQAPRPDITLNILSNSQVVVNNDVVSLRDLPGTLAPLLRNDSSRVVAVGCADEVSHGTFVQVLDVTKLSGAMGIAIADPELKAEQK